MSPLPIIQIHTKSSCSAFDCSTPTYLTLPSTPSPSPLPPNTIRCAPALLTLTSNNLTYLHLGGALSWWDAFPLPASVPVQYTDTTHVSGRAWGYGTVLASRVDGVGEGALLFGYWPIQTVAVELELRPAGCAGHFVEVGEGSGRGKMMNMYNRFIVWPDAPQAPLSRLSQAELDKLAWTAAVRPLWEVGVLMNRFNFGTEEGLICYPFTHTVPGFEPGWTMADADLRKAVVVDLAASGRTALGWGSLVAGSRGVGEGPLGVLSITGRAKGLCEWRAREGVRFKTVGYEGMVGEGAMGWIEDMGPERVVVVDFGGRDNAVGKMVEALHWRMPGVEVMAFGVAFQGPFWDTDGKETRAAGDGKLKVVKFNTSGVRDAAMEKLGEKEYFDQLVKAWREWVEEASVLERMRLRWGEGMTGEEGIEGAWKRICERKLAPEEGLVFKLW